MTNPNPVRLVNSEYDPETGITEEFWHQEGVGNMPGRITMRRLQDVEGQLEFNKEQFNNHSGVGYNDVEGGAFKVASIPLIVVEKWLREGFNWYESTDKERRRKLNDPENRYLLVRPGRL